MGCGAQTTGRPAGAPFSLPPRSGAPGLRSRSPTGGRPRSGVGVRHREVCRLLPGSQPGPLLGLAAAAGTAAGTARAREAGPAVCSKEGAGPAVHKTPFLPPCPALPFSEAAPAPWPRTQGGSGRSRDPLPSRRWFLAAVERARTTEVGHPSGAEKPRTWNREGGQEGRGGSG